jgi:hypothetical protein
VRVLVRKRLVAKMMLRSEKRILAVFGYTLKCLKAGEAERFEALIEE